MKLILVTASAWEAQLSKASNNFLERAILHIWNLEPTISFFSHEFLFIVKYRNLGDPNFILYKITSSEKQIIFPLSEFHEKLPVENVAKMQILKAD